jgi:hypothetical protein
MLSPVFILSLIVAVWALVAQCRSSAKEDPDTTCGRQFVLIVAALICFSYAPRQPQQIDPMRLYFSGSGRRPDHNLSPADYMMGLELGKSHTCTYFNMARDVDIDRLNRCFHFFPDMRSEFVKRYEEQVGFCI